MYLPSLITVAVLASVIMFVASIGMNIAGTVAGLLRNPQPFLLAMFLLMPLFALFVTWLLPVDPLVRTAFPARALSPMAPLLPRREPDPRPLHDHAIRLQVAASITALLTAPCSVLVIGWVFDRTLRLNIGTMELALVATVGAPLMFGVLVNQYTPHLAARIRNGLGRLGMALLAGALWPGAGDLRRSPAAGRHPYRLSLHAEPLCKAWTAAGGFGAGRNPADAAIAHRAVGERSAVDRAHRHPPHPRPSLRKPR